MIKRATICMLTLAAVVSEAHAEDITLGPVTAAAPLKGQNQFNPDVAWGNNGYLVVWQRSRNEAGRVECARLDATGKPLDKAPLVLAPKATWQENPRVAYGGGVYLVVWQDLRNEEDFDIYAARVTGEGKTLDPGGFVIADTAGTSQVYPAVIHDGSAFIVVWSEAQSERKDRKHKPLAIVRVEGPGKVSTPTRLEVAFKGRNSGTIDVKESDLAIAKGRLLIASGGPFFTRLLELSTFKAIGPVETHNRLAVTGARRVSAATNGDSFLVFFWTQAPNHASRLVSSDGTVKAGAVSAIWKEGGGGSLMQPAVAFDGQAYLFAWQMWSGGSDYRSNISRQNARLAVRRIGPDGTPLDTSNQVAVDGTAKQLNLLPRLASDKKGHVMMVWQQHPTSSDGNIVAGTRLLTTR